MHGGRWFISLEDERMDDTLDDRNRYHAGYEIWKGFGNSYCTWGFWKALGISCLGITIT